MNGRWVGVNKELNLVIKIFREEDPYLQECQVYEVLSRNRCAYVPEFYGSFENNSLGLWAILISYEGPEVERKLTESDWQGYFFFFDFFLSQQMSCSGTTLKQQLLGYICMESTTMTSSMKTSCGDGMEYQG